jgi:hypothetical protein
MAVWILGATAVFGWPLYVAEKSGVLGTPGGRLFAIATAILAAAFFGYCGLTTMFIVEKAIGLAH